MSKRMWQRRITISIWKKENNMKRFSPLLFFWFIVGGRAESSPQIKYPLRRRIIMCSPTLTRKKKREREYFNEKEKKEDNW